MERQAHSSVPNPVNRSRKVGTSAPGDRANISNGVADCQRPTIVEFGNDDRTAKRTELNEPLHNNRSELQDDINLQSDRAGPLPAKFGRASAQRCIAPACSRIQIERLRGGVVKLSAENAALREHREQTANGPRMGRPRQMRSRH